MTERKASMGDKVYRGDVVKFIRNNISLGTFMKRTVKTADEACWDLCDKLNYVPAIEEKPEPHWIPVTERLPEAENMYQRPTKRYLCQRECGGVRQFFVGARLYDPKGYLKDWWDWYGTKIRNSEVVAYMPLPEPYKGVTNGN